MSGLFGSTTIEVALGLFFIYWLLSIVCSSIQETIAAWMKWRARDLEKGLRNILCDPAISKAVLNHSLVKSMGNTNAETRMVQILASGRFHSLKDGVGRLFHRVSDPVFHHDFAGRPDYLPSRTFADALLDTLVPATGGALTVARLRQQALALATVGDDAPPSTVPASVHEKAMSDLLKEFRERVKALPLPGTLKAELGLDTAGPAPNDGPATTARETLQTIRARVDDAQDIDSKLRDRITGLITQLQDARQSIGRSVLALIEENRNPATFYEHAERVKSLIRALPTTTLPYDQKRDVLATLAPAQSIEELRSLLDKVGTSHLAHRPVSELISAVESVQTDIEAVRRSVEKWYDHTMDRVSGIYKRRVQTWLLLISFLFTLIVGADSFKMAQMLGQNSTIRAMLVARATEAVATPTSPPTPAAATPGAEAPPPQPPAPVASPMPYAPSEDTQRALADIQLLEKLIGYDERILLLDADWRSRREWFPWSSDQAREEWGRLARKMVGLIITAFAVSLGAPFWFDLLQKVANLRATGKKPEDRDAEERKLAAPAA